MIYIPILLFTLSVASCDQACQLSLMKIYLLAVFIKTLIAYIRVG